MSLCVPVCMCMCICDSVCVPVCMSMANTASILSSLPGMQGALCYYRVTPIHFIDCKCHYHKETEWKKL